MEKCVQIAVCGLFLCSVVYFLYQVLLKYRHRSVRVECWFCCSARLVPVDDVNSFTCRDCGQYNGFTKSGDYNRPIVAQFESNLNPSGFLLNQPTYFNSKSDILCPPCNKYQELKMIELSSFEASSEASWDLELGAFRRKLEHRYPLCVACSTKVRSRISNVRN